MTPHLGEQDLVELALGTLTGASRLAALGHLETCAQCSLEVEQLSTTADQLLNLAPSAEPPIGFEARVFERLGLSSVPGAPAPMPLPVPDGSGSGRLWQRGRRPRPPRRLVALVAAAAALVLVFGVGAAVGRHASSSNYASPVANGGVKESALVSHGHTVGEVLVYAGNPTWLFMYMDDGHWQGTLRCEVTQDQGPTMELGRFWLSQGKGAWAARVDQPAGRLRQARVVSTSGRVLAVADLN